MTSSPKNSRSISSQDYARGVRMTRVLETLARITATLRDFFLTAGRELTGQQLGVAVREIGSLMATTRN